MDELLKPFASYGLAGCLAAAMLWFFWYLISRSGPHVIDEFRQEQKEAREAHASQQERDRVLWGSWFAQLVAKLETHGERIGNVEHGVSNIQRTVDSWIVRRPPAGFKGPKPEKPEKPEGST
jgi:hypothetical protein